MKYIILLLLLISCGSQEDQITTSALSSSEIELDNSTVYINGDVTTECAKAVDYWSDSAGLHSDFVRCTNNKESAVRQLMIDGRPQDIANDMVATELNRMIFENTFSRDELIDYDRYLGLYYYE